MTPEIAHIALSLIKQLNAEIVKEIYEKGLTAQDFFSLTTLELNSILNFSDVKKLSEINREKALIDAKVLWEKMSHKNVKCIFLFDDDYPVRLFNIPDAPIVIYKFGEADLDRQHIISIVGTRKPTPYGIKFCKTLVEDLASYFPEAVIVSGLAYGIDATAHISALESKCTTVGVVAHGLDTIYPASHRQLASDIIKNKGAILSEYPFGEKPFRQRFLERNRIIAALSDVTVVVESNVKGGAMSTANTAFNYSREVMALPGRITDSLSSGCNLLIKKEKARIIESVKDLIDATGWKTAELDFNKIQKSLFPELTGIQKTIYDILKENQMPVQFDKLHQELKCPVSQLMTLLNEMEYDGIIVRFPGNRYSL